MSDMKYLGMTANKLAAIATSLDDENAKLRELIRLMRICIEHACMCDFCPLFVSEDMDELRCTAKIDSRMRELGVTDG